MKDTSPSPPGGEGLSQIQLPGFRQNLDLMITSALLSTDVSRGAGTSSSLEGSQAREQRKTPTGCLPCCCCRPVPRSGCHPAPPPADPSGPEGTGFPSPSYVGKYV